MSCECKEEKEQFKDIIVGVQFEARDIDKFLDAFERARLAVEALGKETAVTAQALERLGRANRAARQSLGLPRWLYRLIHREDTP